MDTVQDQQAKIKQKMIKNEPTNIQFMNLTYKVLEDLKKLKVILKGVSGEFRSGELTAIIGPSGCGKTTLLNLLAGYRIKPLSGYVNVNDLPLKRNKFRKIARYVLQDDLICPYFTIEETLMFASNFKCNTHYSKEERQMEVNEILENFHLMERANTMMSKLSGGERKRVSIALEMLDNPAVLFLDEPTTGLDEFSAIQCIIQLKRLAQSGRTIVCSIHSLSAVMLGMFDNTYVLAEGQCIYQGKGSHIVPYLQRFKLICPLTYNPADFIIEVATFEYGNHNYKLVEEMQNGKIFEWLPDSGELEHQHCVKDKHWDKYDSAELAQDSNTKSCETTTKGMSWWSEYKCIFLHNIKQMQRDKTNLKIRILVHLFLSVIIGGSYFGIGENGKFGVFNFHLCLLTAVMCVFITMSPMFAYVSLEMQYLRRQHFNQWYRLGSWFTALVTAQLPIVFIMTSICSTLIYILTYQPPELFRFGQFVIIMLLTNLVGLGYGVFIGSRMRLMNALFMGPNIIAVWVVFAIQSVNATDTSVFKCILMYSSFVRHSMEGFMSTLFKHNRRDLVCPPSEMFCYSAKPSIILKSAGFTDIDFIRSALCLVAFYVAFVALAYLSFRSRLSPFAVFGGNRYYRYVKQIMANYFNFGVPSK